MLPFCIDQDQKVKTKPANDIPMITWPDGRWCFPANIYMLKLYSKGLSRRTYGGTLRTYASNISHLLRFCFKFPRRDVIDLTDNDFTIFIKDLIEEKKATNPAQRARDSNSVIRIGRNCLDFLIVVGLLYDDDSFIGPTGRVVAEQKIAEIPIGGRTITRTYWHHRAFPTPDPENVNEPISTRNIAALRAAVLPNSTSIFQRKRRYIMLKLLEITGGRRIEVAHLTVKSVRDAAAMAEPKLQLMTAKLPGGREEFRLLPIARHDLLLLVEFIEVNRKGVVRRTCGSESDDGYVLVSETTGFRLRPNTLTQEVRCLAIAAEIHEKISPHMYRHRFITKLFVAIIEQHNFENADDFRRALLDTEGIKVEIQQWTGHKDIRSLDRYIHLAFAEIVKLKKTLNVVLIKRALESFKAGVDQVRSELSFEMLQSNDRASAELLVKLADSLMTDLDLATSPEEVT